MKHVAHERWADVAAGKVPEAEASRLAAHAEACAPCAAARDRIGAARSAFARIRDAEPPNLGWDLLGARLYWSASSEMRRRERQRDVRKSRLRRLVPFAAVGLALASGATAVYVASGPRRAVGPAAPAVAMPAPRPAPQPLPAPIAAPLPLASAVTFLQGEVTVGNDKAAPATALKVGDVVKTGRGRIGLQFGDRSGVLVEPESSLEVVAFDADDVELRVTGAVTVEIERRHEGQRFIVLAGDRRVEVRGTVFRVAQRGGDLDVAVTRGKVAVVEGADVLEVPAPMHLALAASAHIGPMLPAPVLQAASRELADGMHVPMVPVWPGAEALRERSSMIAVTASAKNRVVVDGRPVAAGSFLLRALPGRHLVEVGPSSRWVEVEAGVPAPVAFVDKSVSERPGQVDAELMAHRRAVDQCGDPARKASPGWAGEMRVELGVNADGSIDFAKVVRPSTNPEVDRCLLDLIRDHFNFPPGTKATVQKVVHY